MVVCARPGVSPYRLKQPAPPPGGPARDPLTFSLPGGGEGRAYVFQKTVSNATGSGVAVRASFPLGREPKPEAPADQPGR